MYKWLSSEINSSKFISYSSLKNVSLNVGIKKQSGFSVKGIQPTARQHLHHNSV